MNTKDYDKAEKRSYEAYKQSDLRKVLRQDNEWLAHKTGFRDGYALGKQTETITQEDVEKAAEEHTERILGGYRMDELLKDDLRVDMINLFKDAVDFALGKQVAELSQNLPENCDSTNLVSNDCDADAVIQGWVCRDEDNTLTIFYGSNKPSKEDGDDYWSVVFGDTLEHLNQNMFPDVTWNDPEPTRVEITIKRMKNV